MSNNKAIIIIIHDTALTFCTTYRIVNFDIIFVSGGNRGPLLEFFDEGVEFGFQNLNRGREWIPLAFYSPASPSREEQIRIGSILHGNVVIRGYSVPIYSVGGTTTHRAELKLCGSEIIQSNASLSFRWLQTVITDNAPNRDTVYLDNVAISINFPEGHNIIMMLLDDNFNNEMMIK